MHCNQQYVYIALFPPLSNVLQSWISGLRRGHKGEWSTESVFSFQLKDGGNGPVYPQKTKAVGCLRMAWYLHGEKSKFQSSPAKEKGLSSCSSSRVIGQRYFGVCKRLRAPYHGTICCNSIFSIMVLRHNQYWISLQDSQIPRAVSESSFCRFGTSIRKLLEACKHFPTWW